jgi:glyoxylase-like metal-dependent hydrolase (beta-lactamase superfamily II)
MHRERVSENVFWFQSEVYAQVTAGVVAGPQWAVVIDTLALPEETLAIREFIEHELNTPVRYIINTHYHADHTWGNCFFPGATIISHALCRQLLAEKGVPSLDAARKQNPALRQVKIVLPHMTFEQGELTLRVGKKNLILMSATGHSPDGVSVLVEEDRILFAGDAFMPLPYIVDGDLDEIAASIKRMGRMGLENIIQGHGDIILRGEIDSAVSARSRTITWMKSTSRNAARAEWPSAGWRFPCTSAT